MNEYPYWWDTSPGGRRSFEPTDRKPDQVPSHADVVVVGAGYTGLAAARHLARAGAAAVVIERRQVGWGASSRNGGQVLTGMKLEPATLVARFGEARARQLFDVATESIAQARGADRRGVDRLRLRAHAATCRRRSSPRISTRFARSRRCWRACSITAVQLVPRADQRRRDRQRRLSRRPGRRAQRRAEPGALRPRARRCGDARRSDGDRPASA